MLRLGRGLTALYPFTLGALREGKMENVTVFTANIGRKGSVEQRRENIRRVKDGVVDMNNVIIGWQEIDEADSGDEHGMLVKLWPHQKFCGFSQAVPQLFNAPVVPLRTVISKTCEGRPKVSPARFCVQTTAEVGDLKVVFLNGHYPFNAEDLRRDCNREWTRLTHQWFEAGWTVITTRDTNWHGKMPKLHPKERLLTDAGAIDRITVVEASVMTRVAKRHKINLTIDGHDAVGLTLNLWEKKK